MDFPVLAVENNDFRLCAAEVDSQAENHFRHALYPVPVPLQAPPNHRAIRGALKSADTRPTTPVILSSDDEFRIQYDFPGNGAGSVFDS